jgi:hypothetical protein
LDVTFQQSSSSFKRDPGSSTFERLRSEWIDAFARIEISVAKCLGQFCRGITSCRTPFSQRVDALAKAKPGPHLSKKNAALLGGLPNELAPLMQMRSSIVHSVMVYGERDGTPAAWFRNVLDCPEDRPFFLVMTAEDFSRSKKELIEVSQRLEELLTKAS